MTSHNGEWVELYGLSALTEWGMKGDKKMAVREDSALYNCKLHFSTCLESSNAYFEMGQGRG